MSLFDAFLLDPAPLDVRIAAWTDSVNGSLTVDGPSADLMVEANVVDLDATKAPIEYRPCQTPHFFANQSATGVLIQGCDFDTGAKAGELPVAIADAEGLAV